MTAEQEKAMVLTIEASLWRREVGLAPDWRRLKALRREAEEIDRYWRWRDQVSAFFYEEKER